MLRDQVIKRLHELVDRVHCPLPPLPVCTGYHSAKFGGHRYCGSVNMFSSPVTWLHNQKSGIPPRQVTTLSSLLAICIAEVQIQRFTFVTWPRDHTLTCLSGNGLPIVSYNSVRFGSHRYCGSADIRFYICHVTMSSKGHVTWWMPSPSFSHPPFSFSGSRFYGREDVIFPIPIQIPISMFAN